MPAFVVSHVSEYIATKIFDYLVQNLQDMDMRQEMGLGPFNQYRLERNVIIIGTGKKLYEVSVVELTPDEDVRMAVERRAD